MNTLEELIRSALVASDVHPNNLDRLTDSLAAVLEGKVIARADLATDMTCEAHPWLPWPHDDCIGPGMPWRVSVAMLRRLMEDPPVTGTAVGGFLTCEATGCGRPATQLARFTTGETMATCDDDAPARFASELPNHPQSLVVRSRHPLVAEQWEWPGGTP